MISSNKQYNCQDHKSRDSKKQHKSRDGKHPREEKPKRVAKLIYQIPYGNEVAPMNQFVYSHNEYNQKMDIQPVYIQTNNADITKQNQINSVPKNDGTEHKKIDIPCFDIIRRGTIPYISFWHDKVDVYLETPSLACF